MDWAALQSRITKWEDLHTEFKEWPVHPDRIAAALVAFANTDGGELILGVAEGQRVSGVENGDAVMQKVDQVAYQNCVPPLSVVQETVRTPEGRLVVVVHVPKGDRRPYRTRKGVCYVRTTSGRRQASYQELLRLFQTTGSLFYDEVIVSQAVVEDLDAREFEWFLRQVYRRTLQEFDVGYERLLVNWKLAQEQDGTMIPTVAGVLLFGRLPQQFLPYAYVTAARIPGDDLGAVPVDTEHIEGTLRQLLDDAVRFLRAHLFTPHRIQGFEPEAHPEVPEEALREMLVNALAHRDYTVAAPIRVFVFDDRVEVRSPGGLPNTVTIENVKLGAAHVLRNPTLYTFFRRLGIVTDVGSGIYRTIQLMKKVTGQEPGIFFQGNELVVSLPRQR